MSNYELIKNLSLPEGKDFNKCFKKATAMERKCPEGYKSRTLWKKCKDRFTLDLIQGQNKSVELTWNHGNNTLKPEDFCLNFEEDNQLSANICDIDKSSQKFSFYPILLLISNFFIFLTILIYTVYRKKLIRSYYHKIMLNFAGLMFMAFLTLALNQFDSYVNDAPGLCQFFGFAQQYAFLAAFTFMTVMSIEIMKQIR